MLFRFADSFQSTAMSTHTQENANNRKHKNRAMKKLCYRFSSFLEMWLSLLCGSFSFVFQPQSLYCLFVICVLFGTICSYRRRRLSRCCCPVSFARTIVASSSGSITSVCHFNRPMKMLSTFYK